MTVSRVLALCGLTAGVSLAVAAQPQTQPQTPPKSNPTTPSSSNPRTPSSKNDEASLLKQMEGRWKVEVSIDPAMWNPQLFNEDSRTGTDPNKPATNPATTPGTSPTDTRDPATRTPDSSASNNLSKTVTGYAMVELLGDSVLQETTVLPDMKAKMGETTDRKSEETPGSTGRKSASDDKFKGVSLLSFDESSKTYSMVFVDNCQGNMKHCTGSYDAASNRIVFNSASHGSGHDASNKDSSHKDNTNKDSSNKDNAPSRTGGSGMSDHGKGHSLAGVQVVLEIVNANEHRVTMYANTMPMSADPSRTPASGTPKDPAKDNNPSSNPSSPDRATRPTDVASGKIVYRAVYQRATGDDVNKVRDALRITDANDK